MEFRIPLPTENVSLRRFHSDDVSRTYAWVSRPWYTNDFAGSASPTPETHQKYFENVLTENNQVFLAVCAEGKHIGNAGLKYFDGASCECWYYIGDESKRGKGYANLIVDLLCQVAFSIKGINRVKARVLMTNSRSSKALLLNGFKERGMLSDEKGRNFILYEKRLLRDEHGTPLS